MRDERKKYGQRLIYGACVEDHFIWDKTQSIQTLWKLSTRNKSSGPYSTWLQQVTTTFLIMNTNRSIGNSRGFKTPGWVVRASLPVRPVTWRPTSASPPHPSELHCHGGRWRGSLITTRPLIDHRSAVSAAFIGRQHLEPTYKVGSWIGVHFQAQHPVSAADKPVGHVLKHSQCKQSEYWSKSALKAGTKLQILQLVSGGRACSRVKSCLHATL